MAQFTLGTKVLVKDFAGYGAQLNHNLFAQVTRDLHVTDQHMEAIGRHVHRLAPRFVRIFFDPRALPGASAAADDLMRSFVRTVVLANSVASTINVTWTGGGQDQPDRNMKAFADVLARLVHDHGATKLRWVTVGNEPNRTRITIEEYAKLYRRLRFHLDNRGLARSQVGLMGGDLVQDNQKRWFHDLAHHMPKVLDAWSIHVYWQYDELGVKPKLVKRLNDVHRICNHDLPAQHLQAKPVYVTEYGVRGIWRVKLDVVRASGMHRLKLVKVKPEPGIYKPNGADLRGRRVVDLNLNAFQHAWFNLLAPTLGYHGLSKWDAYFAKYDLKDEPNPQEYGLIGRPQGADLPLRPSYHLTRLFTQTVMHGWNVLEVTPQGTQIVTAFAAPSGKGLTLIGLDTDGATLVNAVKQTRKYGFAKLPKNTPFQLIYWNRRGKGLLTSPPGKVRTDGHGNLPPVEVPLHSVFALTTVPVDI